MCKFKSGIILKNKVVLAPEGKESHSDLLISMNIKDTYTNASKVFVRAELTPPCWNKAEPVEKWAYKVDQDITPDWYDEDPERYEAEMRDAVTYYMKDRLKNVICGYDWTPVKDGEYTYYFMNNVMCESAFGKTNDYKTSYVREKLLSNELFLKLKEQFGDKLTPINLDLTSMDGFKCYGKLEGDFLAIPNVELMMKFGGKIPLVDKWYWLSTPNQTPARRDSALVRSINYVGVGDYESCGGNKGGIRPFFILKS